MAEISRNPGIGLALVPNVAGTLGFTGVKLQPFTLKPAVSSELTLVWRTALCGFALTSRGGCLQLGSFTAPAFCSLVTELVVRAWHQWKFSA